MSTAGSLEGICCRKGRISSMTNHLSRYSKIFPRHTRELTRTYTVRKENAHADKVRQLVADSGGSKNIILEKVKGKSKDITSKKNIFFARVVLARYEMRAEKSY